MPHSARGCGFGRAESSSSWMQAIVTSQCRAERSLRLREDERALSPPLPHSETIDSSITPALAHAHHSGKKRPCRQDGSWTIAQRPQGADPQYRPSPQVRP